MSDSPSGDGSDRADPPVALDEALDAIAEGSPLVHCITNDVTVGDVANVTLHWGGLPVMAVDPREVEDMAGVASGLLLNMGTVNEDEETMIAAGQAANESGTPVAFDPVGAGGTPLRGDVARRTLEDVDVSIVKGNYGEVTALAGEDAAVRGVESVGEYAEIVETAMALAADAGAVVVASGEVDVVATADAAYEVECGDPMMGRFVGTGCMLGATMATFAGALAAGEGEIGGDGDAAEERSVLGAALAGAVAFGIAGERAAGGGEWNGPASYATAFHDAVATLDGEGVVEGVLGSRVDLVADR